MKRLFLFVVMFGLSACEWQKTEVKQYQYQGVSASVGQNVAEVFDANGAPNLVKQLNNGAILWVYYTNYRPVGGGEIISYDMPPQGSGVSTCSVQIVLVNDVVSDVFSNCD